MSKRKLSGVRKKDISTKGINELRLEERWNLSMLSSDAQLGAGPLCFLCQYLMGQVCGKAAGKTALQGLWLWSLITKKMPMDLCDTAVMCEHNPWMLEGRTPKKGKLLGRGLCRESGKMEQCQEEQKEAVGRW